MLPLIESPAVHATLLSAGWAGKEKPALGAGKGDHHGSPMIGSHAAPVGWPAQGFERLAAAALESLALQFDDIARGRRATP